MKSLLFVIILLTQACGTDEKKQSNAPTPTVRAAYADLSASSPTADIGFNNCRLATTVAETDARTAESVVLGGETLTYRYNTVDGAFYLSADNTKSMQVFKQGFVRVSITCPIE